MRGPVPLPASLRVALSFLALALGWALAYVGLILSQVHGAGFGYVTDFEFFLLWSVLFAVVGWALVVVPLVRYVDPGHWIFEPRWAPVVGAVAGVVILTVLLAPFRLWAGGQPRLLTVAAGTGLVGWASYTLAIRSPLVERMAGRRPVQAAGLYLVPLGAALVFALGVWPLLERAAPAVAFRYGSPAARARIAGRLLSEIHAGDRVADVDRRLPGLLPPAPPGESVRITGNLGPACYGLDVEDGVVGWIGFEDPCRGLAGRPGTSGGGPAAPRSP